MKFQGADRAPGNVLVGGVLNTLLALFHGFLGRQIHLLAGVNPGHRALMEMLNPGGTLMIVFFAAAWFACASDLLGTRLGKLVLGFVSALYLSRAAEEIVIAPRFSALIFAVCVLVALIYLALLVVPPRHRHQPIAAEGGGA